MESMNPSSSPAIPLSVYQQQGLAYTKVQYDALKSDMYKYAIAAGLGGLVAGFLAAKFLK